MSHSIKLVSGYNVVVEHNKETDIICFTSNDLDFSPIDLHEERLVAQLFPEEVDEFILALLRGIEAETGVRSALLDKLEA